MFKWWLSPQGVKQTWKEVTGQIVLDLFLNNRFLNIIIYSSSKETGKSEMFTYSYTSEAESNLHRVRWVLQIDTICYQVSYSKWKIHLLSLIK